MQAVILAGGKGTRLKSGLGDLPKPMVDFCGKPLLEHQIELLRSYGCSDILLLLGYNPDAVIGYLGDGQGSGVGIRYVIEETPLGSAGAVLAAFDLLEEQFLLLYGDTALNVDLDRLRRRHRAEEAQVTLFVHPNDHPYDSDLVETGPSGRIKVFHACPHPSDRDYSNLVNAALYVIEKSSLAQWRTLPRPLDFGRDLFPRMLEAGQFLFGYRSREYIRDIGTPARLAQAEKDFSSGRIAKASLATPAPAVFLDRDGTINEDVNRVSSCEQFRLLPNAGAAIRRLNQSGYVVPVVSNQPVISRGDCTEQTLREIHNRMETLLGKSEAYVDAIYYCPHHPEKGFAGERAELKFRCACRKPATGMIDLACAEMNIDRRLSWFIGDSEADLQAAHSAGIRSILVETGRTGAGKATTPAADHRFPSLVEAAEFLARSRMEE